MLQGVVGGHCIQEWERSTGKNYQPVSLLSVVSKLFFSDFQYDFRSSRSVANLLTVVSDRIARAYNRSGAT